MKPKTPRGPIGNTTGRLGEDIALRYFIDRGFSLVCRNYHKPYGEIDLVLSKGYITHFVEVKSVSYPPARDLPNQAWRAGVTESVVSHENIRPEDNIHSSKLQKLSRVIDSYISAFHVKNWQFDVCVVRINKNSKKAMVKLIENQLLQGE